MARQNARQVRLTPARAGNTGNAGHGCFCDSAHPRSRGEHSKITTDVPAGRGSPPLARGTLANAELRKLAIRLTPARAGNTC